MSIYYISFYNAESDNHGSFLSKQVLLRSFLSPGDNLFQICLGNGLVGSLNRSRYFSNNSVLINAELPTLYTASSLCRNYYNPRFAYTINNRSLSGIYIFFHNPLYLNSTYMSYSFISLLSHLAMDVSFLLAVL